LGATPQWCWCAIAGATELVTVLFDFDDIIGTNRRQQAQHGISHAIYIVISDWYLMRPPIANLSEFVEQRAIALVEDSGKCGVPVYQYDPYEGGRIELDGTWIKWSSDLWGRTQDIKPRVRMRTFEYKDHKWLKTTPELCQQVIDLNAALRATFHRWYLYL
jgi:hypothetical protein